MQPSSMINGRYLLHEKIGQGGMGIVHRATDRLTGETVALKQVFLPIEQIMFASRPISQTNRELRLALAHEFQVLAGLRHPNIISVLDYGFDENRQPFFTMSYLEDAKTIVAAANGRSVPEKITLLLQTLEALAYLHRRGILHRDLKPDNVLVVGDTVRVLDFGLAAAKEQATDSVGSWLYMAPEVLLGRPATEASDLYTVGVLAYRLLAGTHPFDIYAEDTVGEILDREPDWSKVDDSVQAVIRTLLAKKPENRYQTAVAASTALARVIGLPEAGETAVIRESYLQAATFVGRENEFAQLTAALQHTHQGHGQSWLIGGESGVGKTRLLDELRIHALVNGFQVLRGQGVEGGGLPYQLWREPLRRLVLLTELTDLEAGILKPLIPDITNLLQRPIPDAPHLTGAGYHERLLFTALDLFRRQRHPILLLAEDLHWTTESLIWLQHLSQLVSLLPILILGSYREDEKPNLSEQFPKAHLIKLGRLNEQAVAQLTQAMIGEPGKNPALLHFIQQETEGNVFFMVEVVRVLAAEAGDLGQIGRTTLPKTFLAGGVQQVLQRRVARMPAWGQSLLQFAAVSGRQLNLRLLATFAPDLTLTQWLNVGAEVALFEAYENQWRFSHDKLREAVLGNLSNTERAILHQQVAEAIEQTYPNDEAWNEQLMEHWRQAGVPTKELPYILQVVRQLQPANINLHHGLNLIMRGVDLAEQNQDAWIRLRLLIEQSSIYDTLGEYDLAEKSYKQALPQAQQYNFPTIERQVHNGLARIAWQRGDQAAILFHANLALTMSRDLGDKAGLAHSLNQLGLFYDNLGDLAKARTYYLECMEVARALGDDSRYAIAVNNIGEGLMDEGDYVSAYQYYQEAYAIDKRHGNRHEMAASLANLGANALARGAWHEARDFLSQSIHFYREMDSKTYLGLTLNNMAVVELIDNNYAAAEQRLRENMEFATASGNRLYFAETMLLFGKLHQLQGDFLAAYADYTQAVEMARNSSQAIILVDALTGQSYVQDDLYAAWQGLQEALNIAQNHNIGRLRTNIVTGFAHLYMRQGNLTRAVELCGLLDAQGTFDHQAIRKLYREPLKVELRAKLGEAVYEEASKGLLGQPLQDVAQALLDSRHSGKMEHD